MDGQLGHGDAQNQLLPKKVEALAGQRVVAVSARGMHSLAITADGSVWSWGYGALGQLGHGDTQDQLLPKKVEAFGPWWRGCGVLQPTQRRRAAQRRRSRPLGRGVDVG